MNCVRSFHVGRSRNLTAGDTLLKRTTDEVGEGAPTQALANQVRQLVRNLLGSRDRLSSLPSL